MSESILSLAQIAQRLSLLAKKNMENLNCLAQASKTQVLLKQYALEQFESQQQTIDVNRSSSAFNIKVLLRELIDLKKENFKHSYLLNLIASKQPLTSQDKRSFKDKLVSELRTFIADEILPQLKLEELSASEEKDLDADILNLSFTLESLETDCLSFDSVIKPQPTPVIVQQAVKQQESGFGVRQSQVQSQPVTQQKVDVRKETSKFQHFGEPIILKKQVIQKHVDNDEDEEEDDSENESSFQSSKAQSEYQKHLLQQHQQEFAKRQNIFKKQTVFSGDGSQQSPDDVIIEEEKESDYTLQTEQNISPEQLTSSYGTSKFAPIQQDKQRQSRNLSQQQLPSNGSSSQMSTTQRLKRLSKQSDNSSAMRADKFVQLSKGFTERCFLKFINHFLQEKPDQPITVGACSGNSTLNKQDINLNLCRSVPKAQLPPRDSSKSPVHNVSFQGDNNRKKDTSQSKVKAPQIDEAAIKMREWQSRSQTRDKSQVSQNSDDDDNFQRQFKEKQKKEQQMRAEIEGLINKDKRFTFNAGQNQLENQAQKPRGREMQAFRKASDNLSSQMSSSSQSRYNDY